VAVHEGDALDWSGPDPAPDPVPTGDGWSTVPAGDDGG
jgi:hypothetical protein